MKKVSIGKEKLSIGFSVDRKQLSLDLADRLLVCAQLHITLQEDDPDQTKFCGMEGLVFSTLCEVKRISVTADVIGGTMSFVRDKLDLDSLTAFAQQTCRIDIKRIGSLEESSGDIALVDVHEEEEEEGEEEEEEDEGL